MDTRLRALVVVAIAAATLELAMAVDHDVGGPAGSWDLSTNHKQWASGKKFIAGDTLTFNYASGQHNVLEVSKAAYSSCSTTNPISTGTGGNTVISLKTAGKRYFICGIPGHCAGGMKLEINVAPAAKSSPAPRSPAAAPSPSTSSPAPLSPAAAPSTSLSSPVAAPLPESSSSGSSDSPPVPSSSPRTIANAALRIGAGTMLFLRCRFTVAVRELKCLFFIFTKVLHHLPLHFYVHVFFYSSNYMYSVEFL